MFKVCIIVFVFLLASLPNRLKVMFGVVAINNAEETNIRKIANPQNRKYFQIFEGVFKNLQISPTAPNPSNFSRVFPKTSSILKPFLSLPYSLHPSSDQYQSLSLIVALGSCNQFNFTQNALFTPHANTPMQQPL